MPQGYVSHFSRAIIWRYTGHFLSITAYKRYEILLPHLWGGFPPRRLSTTRWVASYERLYFICHPADDLEATWSNLPVNSLTAWARIPNI
jgi:hypothetical protein